MTDQVATEEGENKNETQEVNGDNPNILLIIADDMGLDACPGYQIGDQKPTMPNLQGMINTGIRFNNVWANAVCTPTRSSILTGKYGFRNGMTKVGDELSTSETSIQSFLDMHTNEAYSNSVIGKWHLSENANHPASVGIRHYAGLLSGGVQSYSNWNLTENGQTSISNEYSTTKLTDLAIDWLDQQTKPWFLWLAYNSPHTPFHLPPDSLHTQNGLATDQASIDANPTPYYMAMLEAMDTEIGRLLNTLSTEELANTIIIFLGDNGSPNQVAQEYNSRRVKGSIYQGGINVPMIISGKGVNRFNQTEDALINSTDLFATIADIAGTGITDINDSKSFKPLFNSSSTIRSYVYSEVAKSGSTQSDIAIRNNTHKYILFSDGKEGLFDLSNSFFENVNLLNENQLPLNQLNSASKTDLVQQLGEIRKEQK